MNVRVGAVSYLNTKPLIYGFDQWLPNCSLELDLPSRLADRLANGQLDVALIPSIEYFRLGGGSIVSDACIACRGPVWSVQLWFRKPPPEVRSISLDEGSRTSAVLAQTLLWQRYAIRPKLECLTIGSSPRLAHTDAVLVIGDRAIGAAPDEFVEVWDLGDQWCRHTELPFVFAMWVAREPNALTDLAWGLQAARDSGLANLAAIAQREAPGHNMTVDDCTKYFRDFLHFRLGHLELKGLELFYKGAVELGLAPTGRELNVIPGLPV